MAADNCPSTTGRLFIADRTSKIHFLVDTGSDLCVYPRFLLKEKPNKTDYQLRAANGSIINTYGHISLKLDFGLRRSFTWRFVVADVTKAIIAVLAQEYQLPEDKRQQLKDMLTAQCKKNGAEDKVADVEAAGRAFVECLKGLVDIGVLKNEIEDAKPIGALDEVFKKYCAKSPQLNGCINSLLDGVTPCVDPNARGHLESVKNSTNQLIDFICYKDGDRIALFIAEGGPECFQEKADSIKTCFTKLRESFPTAEAAKSLSTAERCAKFDELTTCVVTSLEQCSNPTPGNMADSLFRFIRKGLPCATN